MNKKVIIALIIICALTLGLRLLSYHNVFGGSFPSFLETDAYSRMYYAEKIAQMPFFDGLHYTFYNALLFPGIIAWLSNIMPLELAGAWLPPILAVGTVILVFGIGKRLFSPTAGLLGALFTSIIPSEFLHRTLLGFADHHALEVFLFTLTVYLIIRAFQSGNWWKWTIPAGISLWLYLVTWKSGLLLVGIIGLAGLVILINGIIRKTTWKSTVIQLLVVGAVFLVFYLPTGGYDRLLGFLPVANVPDVGINTREIISTVATPMGKQTISELMPLLFPAGKFSFGVISTNLSIFTVTFIIGVIYLWKRRPSHEKVFLMVWTLVILALTLMQRRNIYYLTVNIGLLSGLALWEVTSYLKGDRAVYASILCIPLLVVAMPLDINLSKYPHFQMSEEWHAALVWLDKQDAQGHVTAWTDYGHWIKYVTGNEPNGLPGPGGTSIAQLLLSTDAAKAKELMTTMDTEYLIVDAETLNNKMTALRMVAGENPSVKETLIYRLINRNDPQPYLTLVYKSETIKIFKNTEWGK